MAEPGLSTRLEGVSESATLKLNAAVQAMKAQGVDVVNLTAGEPDFFVPEAGKRGMIDAVHANRSKYTPVPGIPELRALVAEKTNRQQPSAAAAQAWQGRDVVVTNGGKQALFNTFMAILNPGDEVLVPSPYWLSYPEMVKLAGGRARIVETRLENRFKLTPPLLREALAGGRVKALVLNSPSNPTGVMYTREEFAALAEVLKSSPGGKDVWVISDEIYDRIVLGDVPFCSFLEAAPFLRDQVVTVNGMSKSAAMTGWRVGWTVAPARLTQALITLQGQSTSGINAPAQWASVAVLKLPESEFSQQIESFRKRKDLVLQILGKPGKIKVVNPDGAFYAFLGIESFLRDGEDSIQFAERLLEEAKVAVVPGTPFGAPKFIRISFATDEKSLREGCERIASCLE